MTATAAESAALVDRVLAIITEEQHTNNDDALLVSCLERIKNRIKSEWMESKKT